MRAVERTPDIDRTISAWLDDRAVTRAPGDLLGETLARTERTRPRPAWRIPERWIPMPMTLRLAVVPRAVLYLLLLALLVTLLATGGLIVGALRGVSPPPPASVAANGLIAYSDLGDIWLVDERDEERRELTSGPDVDMTGAWSPDGTLLAYWSIVDFTGDPANEMQRLAAATSGGLALKVISLDDPEPRTLVSGLSPSPYSLGNDFDWSPDGRSIAFAHQARGDDGSFQPQIDVVDLDSLEVRSLTRPGLAPSWSPDGQHIAYASFAPDGVYVVAADGGNPTRLSQAAGNTSGGAFHEPQWSNDGRMIVFHAGWGFASDVWVAQVDGTGEVVIATEAATERWPRWSPTSDRIAFGRVVSPTDGTAQYTQVVLSDPDGNDQVTLDHPPAYFWQKEWSPDGAKIASFTHDDDGGWSGLVVIDVSGATPAVVMPVPDYRVDNVGRLAWQPVWP